MAKDRVPLGASDYVNDADETWILAWVSVNQVMGTRGLVRLFTHHHRDDASERLLADFRGDAKANDFPAVIKLLRMLLETAEKTYALERERQSVSNK